MMMRIALISAFMWWSVAWPAPSATPLGPILSTFAEACLSGGPNFPNAQGIFEKTFDSSRENDAIAVSDDLINKTSVWRDDESFLAAALNEFPKTRTCELEFKYDDSDAVWFSLNNLLERRFAGKFDIVVNSYGPLFRIDAYERPIFVEIRELSVNTVWEGMMGLKAGANKE